MTASPTQTLLTDRVFSPDRPPQNLCLLRLSALGDITHVLPTLRTLQQHWPQTKICWVIGKGEYPLVKDIDGVDFIVFDKASGLGGMLALRRKLRRQLARQGSTRFDVLLHMQLSLRASLLSAFIPARLRLGFDRERARDLQGLFCNARIQPTGSRQHVLDSFLEFPRYFGLDPVIQWRLPVDEAARKTIEKRIGSERRLFVINPCAVAKAKNWRNWTADGYAAAADHAAEKHDMRVVLSGGGSEQEMQMAQEIIALCKKTRPLNLVGQTSLAELVALLDAAWLVLAPDTGPLHIASALDTPVIGLYASTNPQRAGPYLYQHCVVDHYPQALQQYHQLKPETAPWGKRIKNDQAMRLITSDEVKRRIDECMMA